VKILIIDNHELILDSIKNLLTENIPTVKIWSSLNSEVAINYINDIEFDFIICDYKLDELNGIDIYQYVKNKGKKCKFLILSMINDPVIIETILEYGVNGFICKDGSKSELIKAINELKENEKFICVASQEILKNHKRKSKIPVFLTKREFEILGLIMKEYKNQDIAKRLSISVSTVETHKKNLIAKLEVKSTVGLVKYVIEKQLF
jgi:DNA-binding NarL/FixJ family response regulator